MAAGGENAAEAKAVPAPPLAIPIFRAMWIANIASNFGSLIQSVGAAWLMTSLTRSPVMVALVQSSTTFPIMLLSLLAGAIADNLDRRRVMLAAQGFMLVASAVLVGFTWAGLLTPWLLLAFTFSIGCGVAINAPCAAASVGDMVPRETLPAAVAMNSMGFNGARSLGPAIGGLIVATAGVAVAFVVNALSYVGLIGVLARWRPDYPKGSLPREGLGVAVAAGPRYVVMSPHLRVVMVRSACLGIFASAAPALMPLIVRDVIHGGASLYGLLSAAFGVGAVGGALLLARLRNGISSENIVRASVAMLAVGTAGAGLSGIAALTLPSVMLAGAGWVLGLSTCNILVQMAAPRWVVGRALSCYQMAAFGAMAAGSWIIGILAAHFGVLHTLLLLAALQAANIPLGLVLPLEEMGALNLDPLAQSYEPATDVQVSPRSGPVVIAVTYRIAPADVSKFLGAMQECRRIRKRDGAGDWTLLRDLGDAERWIERFRTPTWVDYLRHIRRRTHDDLVSWERVAQLHIGPERPQVTRFLERQAVPPSPGAATDPLAEPTGLV